MQGFILCGIRFHKMNARCAARKLVCALKGTSRQTAVFTPNISILRKCYADASLRKLINRGDILLPDGAGVALMCKVCGHGHIPRITGIDMGYFLLRYCERSSHPVYLLGGRRGVADRAAKRLKSSLPRLNICGVHHGYFDKSHASWQNREVIDSINKVRPALLLVCMGNPMQERWIIENRKHLPSVKVFMGLGGSLDVWSGDVKRAPLFLRVLDLEWLWRSIQKSTKR